MEPGEPGLLAVARPGRLHIERASHAVIDTGVTLGGVYGPVTAAEALALVQRMRRHDDPGGPDCPWAAVALRQDGTVVAAASSMLTSGLFHASDDTPAGAQLTLATDPVQVLAARPEDSPLDEDYLAAFATRAMPLTTTPYVGITRTTTGETLLWSGGAVRLRQWLGPDTAPERTLRGDRARRLYRAAFDEVVADLAKRAHGPLAATVSGGLDSTFMAAALARTTTAERPVHGFCYSPLSHEVVSDRSGWVPDDYPYAKMLAGVYPDRLTVTPVRNEAGIRPSQAAETIMRRSGLPAWAPLNQIWLNDITRRARDLGASAVFVGNWGNATFSGAGTMTARALAAQRSPRELVGLLHGSYYSRSSRLGVARRIVRAVRFPEPATAHSAAAWMTGHLRGNPAGGHPRALRGLLRLDPYASRRIVEIALAICWQTWVQGPDSRAFARVLADGRTPDAIRLRSARGAQGPLAVSQDTDLMRANRSAAVSRFPALWGPGGELAKRVRQQTQLSLKFGVV